MLTFPVGVSPEEQCIEDIHVLQDNLFEGNPENLQDMTFRVFTSYNGISVEVTPGIIFIAEASSKIIIAMVISCTP